MDCLQNRIGISGCGSTPDAILLVNQLPGVTTDFINALINDDQETFLGLWEDIKLRVIKKFQILVKAQFNRCFTITDNSILECLVCENKELFDVALWYLHGTELMIECTSGDVFSQYNTIGYDKAEKLKIEFYGEFQAALNDAVIGIDPQKSTCFPDVVSCSGDALKWDFACL